MKRLASLAGLAAIAALVLDFQPFSSRSAADPVGIHKIQHVVVIMQENRSFDSYFGTYPGADGIPMQNGVPTVCVPNPTAGACVKPFHDRYDLNHGGPHGAVNAAADINDGAMNGFVGQATKAAKNCATSLNPNCSISASPPDVMGYHTRADIPNYWGYAKNFVLQDRMFEPNSSWSLPAHLFMVSGWSAKCTSADPMSCQSALQSPDLPPDARKLTKSGITPAAPNYAWTDLTYLLHKNAVSWAYYVAPGTQPDCANDAMTCTQAPQNPGTPGIWNPLPWFETVQQDRQLGNIQDLDKFYAAAKDGSLPAVSWIDPNGKNSEHPPALVSAGQSYVTGLINAIMQGPDWNSTAIFLAWDDWGGFYDHAVPPSVDANGYGLRVPGLVISPYAKTSYIDHQTLSFDAYLKFIEDDFLGSQRIDPRTDGRPDSRPNVRENVSVLGDLTNDFNFNQSPRPPLLLPVAPKTDLISTSAAIPQNAAHRIGFGRVVAITSTSLVIRDDQGLRHTIALATNPLFSGLTKKAKKHGIRIGDEAVLYSAQKQGSTAALIVYDPVRFALPGQIKLAGLTGQVSLHSFLLRLDSGTEVTVRIPLAARFVAGGMLQIGGPQLVPGETITVIGRQLTDGSIRALTIRVP